MLLCLPVHECAHAWSAKKLGDPTAEMQGRITLNPLAHLTLPGVVMMLVLGVGYAKPVPVNTMNFPEGKRKQYYALTALAGPLSNLLFSAVLIVISSVLFRMTGAVKVCSYIYTAAYINVSLAVFNMIPVPPLDGSSLLMLVLPDGTASKLYRYRNWFVGGLFILIYVLSYAGISPLSKISMSIFEGMARLLVK